MVVIDAADLRRADALPRELGLDVVTIPDPRVRMTDRFGVDVWSTTITLDRQGIVTDTEVGVPPDGPGGLSPRRDRARPLV